MLKPLFKGRFFSEEHFKTKLFNRLRVTPRILTAIFKTMKNCFVIFFGKIINTNRVILIEILRRLSKEESFE